MLKYSPPPFYTKLYIINSPLQQIFIFFVSLVIFLIISRFLRVFPGFCFFISSFGFSQIPILLFYNIFLRFFQVSLFSFSVPTHFSAPLVSPRSSNGFSHVVLFLRSFWWFFVPFRSVSWFIGLLREFS